MPGKPKAFDQNLQPVTVNGTGCCEDIITQLQNLEALEGLRKRKRKQTDQQIFQETVYCIVSNLVLSELNNPDAGVRITRSHSRLGRRDRYRTKVLGKTFPKVIDLMEHPPIAFLMQEKAEATASSKAQQSIIYATERIRRRIRELGLSAEDFGHGEYPEEIILKSMKAGYWDKSGYLQYEDTPDTVRLRSEVKPINNWLMSLDIQLESTISDRFNVNDRKLRRYFTRGDHSFNSGGRLFGGFWLEMGKRQRKHGLYLDEESIATLDVKNLTSTILYGIAGKTPPPGDAYRIKGLEAYRKGVKQVFSSMTFTDGPLKRFPKGVKAAFRDEFRFHHVVNAIKSKHQPIAHLLDSQIGHQIQKVESDIMVKALLMCMEEGISALPVHDALIVPEIYTEQGIVILKAAFKAVIGATPEVSIER